MTGVLRLAVALALVASVGIARADDVYFHKAGATWAQYEADLTACGARTRHSLASISDTSGVAAGGGPLGIAIDRLMTQIVSVTAAHDQRIENLGYCMALRHWTTVSVDNLRDDAHHAIDVDQPLDERIKAWFAEPAPPVGNIVLRPDDTVREDARPPPPMTPEAVQAERAVRRGRR